MKEGDVYWTPKMLDDKCNEYFVHATSNGDPINILSMCDYIGLLYHTLNDWEKDITFAKTIKKIKQKIEAISACKLFTEKNVTGIIFYLKNFGKWTDKQEIKQDTTAVNTNYNYDFSKKSDEEIQQMLEKANNGEDIDI